MTQVLSETVAAFIGGSEDHYIDHLAPLCDLLQVPLYVTSPLIQSQVKRFYPNVQVILGSYEKEIKTMFLSKRALLTCYSKLLLDQMFFYCLATSNHRPHYIWCPHGNSEKGFNGYFENLLKEEKFVLCYGPKVERQLRKAGIKDDPLRIPLGNYRYFYYQKEKKHFNRIVQKHCPYLLNPGKKILYAPTWSEQLRDEELKAHLSLVFSQCPSSYTLIVKLHPNVMKKYEVVLSHLKEEFSSSRLHFLENFPPIYPLLAFVDYYIGNHSSILFDTLALQMPCFLIDEQFSFAYSISSTKLEELFPLIESVKPKFSKMKAAYKEAYFPDFSVGKLKERLIKIVQSEESAFCKEAKEGMTVT